MITGRGLTEFADNIVAAPKPTVRDLLCQAITVEFTNNHDATHLLAKLLIRHFQPEINVTRDEGALLDAAYTICLNNEPNDHFAGAVLRHFKNDYANFWSEAVATIQANAAGDDGSQDGPP